VKLALAGDTMLGRKVADAIRSNGPASLFAPDVVALAREADLFVLNLECCISDRGRRWADPYKPFFFRAPPEATEALVLLGVDCVTLANNHALDFGQEALLDTFEHLRSAGIRWVGAGPELEAARAPVVLDANGFRLAVAAFSDHPAEYEAATAEPGIAFADLRRNGLPAWLRESLPKAGAEADALLVTPHWGPNMTAAPVRHVRAGAKALRDVGASLIAGHSAHVFQGVERSVLYDLGGFVDDYAVDARLRNDLGLLFLVELDGSGPVRLEAVPLKLDYCHTRLAEGDDAAWIRQRFREACAAFGSDVCEQDERLVVERRPRG
jgi:poly-gamma-glutamate capsule biosynthesis protein CapA/YwtB (metallophosphatase superfamily)